MGLLKTIGSLFGTDTGKKVVDAAIKTGDALFFTDEEKSKANFEVMKLQLEFAKSTTGSRVARRLLAVMFGGTFLLLILVAVAFGVIGRMETADYILLVVKDTLATPIAVILGFYFFAQLGKSFQS